VKTFFHQFYGNEVFPKGLLSYFVRLIPKVNVPLLIKEFRPISLLGSLYRLDAKVLNERLSKVMNSVTSKSQLVFLKGRHLLDGVMIVNEVVDLTRKRSGSVLFLRRILKKLMILINSFLEIKILEQNKLKKVCMTIDRINENYIILTLFFKDI